MDQQIKILGLESQLSGWSACHVSVKTRVQLHRTHLHVGAASAACICNLSVHPSQVDTWEFLEVHVSANLVHAEGIMRLYLKKDGRQGLPSEVVLWPPHAHCSMYCPSTYTQTCAHIYTMYIHTFQNKFFLRLVSQDEFSLCNSLAL